MKILHLSSEKSWRGGERQISFLIEEHRKKAVDVFVACRKNSAFEEYCRKNSISHRSFSFSGEFDISTALCTKKYCNDENIDIIHTHSGKSHGLAYLSYLLGNKTPLVVSRRVDFPIKGNIISRAKYNSACVKRIICVSDAIKEIVEPSIKNPERLVTIHSGIDTSLFADQERNDFLREKFNIPKSKTIVVNTSAIAPHKDYYTFVDTAELVLKQSPDFHFFIIGDGPEKNIIAEYISRKNLKSNITMTGFMDNVPEILKSADIFLITSKTEGLGTTILDSFASNLPVVATNAGGIPELVIDGKTGLLAMSGNSKMLSKHIIELSKDAVLRNKITEAAGKHLQKFTKTATAEKTFSVYMDILNKHK